LLIVIARRIKGYRRNVSPRRWSAEEWLSWLIADQLVEDRKLKNKRLSSTLESGG
jgi:hypothetical protein